MKFPIRLLIAIALCALPGCASHHASHADPLPSWSDGQTKASIIQFVSNVTDTRSPRFVPPDDRVATFDNDGTLWVEQPLYTQLVFAIERIKTLAPHHPEWKTTEPFKSILEGDPEAALAGGDHAIVEIIGATHAGMSSDDFARIVTDWIDTAKQPRFHRLYTQCVYQPQLELLEYLRDNGFRTFIVSGGGIEFMRPWTERVYGIEPAQVVGSSIVTEFKMIDGKPVLMRLPKVNFVDDKAGKPVGIGQHIGQRPILAFGNSDGDRQMLEYTTIDNPHPSLGLLVLHNDSTREYAYGPAAGLPDSHVGTFPQSLLDEADQRDWIVVRMKEDWGRIFPEQ